ncbi:hypothetical protein ACOMHN_015521 [Nucella lapillus]
MHNNGPCPVHQHSIPHGLVSAGLSMDWCQRASPWTAGLSIPHGLVSAGLSMDWCQRASPFSMDWNP